MSRLNWSLKLHIRLRTISFLISTHFTQVYVQWMPYSFVWLYLIKCVFTCSIFVDQIQIFFLSVLVVFGKYFVFAKMSKISKTSVALFWRLSCGLIKSHAPVASPHKIFLRLTGESMSQSRKILRIFFKIWIFNVSRSSVWRLVHRWRFQSRRYSEIFAAYVATSLRVEHPVAKNT